MISLVPFSIHDGYSFESGETVSLPKASIRHLWEDVHEFQEKARLSGHSFTPPIYRDLPPVVTVYPHNQAFLDDTATDLLPSVSVIASDRVIYYSAGIKTDPRSDFAVVWPDSPLTQQNKRYVKDPSLSLISTNRGILNKGDEFQLTTLADPNELSMVVSLEVTPPSPAQSVRDLYRQLIEPHIDVTF